MTDITLSGAQRNSLLSLIKTQKLSDRTQNRLASGRAINSVVDGAVAYFRNRSLMNRVKDFEQLKDEIDQAVSAVRSTLDGLDAVDNLLRQGRGLVEAARSQTLYERRSSNDQFQTIFNQIYELVEDTSYQGTNMINGSDNILVVRFGVRTNSRIVIKGFNLNNTVANSQSMFSFAAFSNRGKANVSNILNFSNGFSVFGSNNSAVTLADNAINRIDIVVQRLRGVVAEYGSNIAILQTRFNFTQNYSANLQSGADNLVRADLNEEGANMVALQTRQQLGIQALAVSGQQQQAILTLFR